MINNLAFPIRVAILQSCYYGPIYAGGISNWLARITNNNVLIESKQVSVFIKKMEEEGLVEFYKSASVDDVTRGIKRKYFRITDKGRVQIIQIRETLKSIFSDIPEEAKKFYKLENTGEDDSQEEA